MKRSRLVLAALCLAASLVSCLSILSAPARAEMVLKVGYMPIGDCLQLYVAEDMGFFAEAGLRVDKLAMKGGAVIAPAVEAGEIEIGWSNVISLIIAHAKGFDFQILTPGALEIEGANRVHALLAAKDGPVASVAELSGKTVAINTLGNINELSMLVLMEQNGLDRAKVRLVEVPFPDMAAALASGSAQAALAIEPFLTAMRESGTVRELVPAVHRTLGERFMIGGWFGRKEWATKNPDKLRAFQAAIAKATGFILEHPDKVREILVANTKLKPELAARIALPGFTLDFGLPDLQRLIDLSAKYAFIPAPFPAGEIVAAGVK